MCAKKENKMTSTCGKANGSFLASGRMFVGANYWASHSATRMWREWDAKAIQEDLRTLADAGIRLLRVFPNWADFQPIHACFLSGNDCRKVYETRMFDSEEPLPDTPCGRAGVDERMVERFEAFCDMADAFGNRADYYARRLGKTRRTIMRYFSALSP